MITNQVIQTSIEELKAITKIEINVYSADGLLVAGTGCDDNINKKIIEGFVESPADSQVIGLHHLLKVNAEDEVAYVVVASGSGDDAYTVGKIAVSQLKNLMVAYKEKYDKNSFFQSLLMDNLLLVDIYNRAKKLKVEINACRMIFIVEAKQDKDNLVPELLKGMFLQQSGDFVTSVDEDNVILIKTLRNGNDKKEMEEIADTIVTLLNTEAMLKVRVAYGTAVDELKDLSKSYKEAKMALEVGKIFYAEKDVNCYSDLGIGRLIYQLPINLCKMFLDEVFSEDVMEELDEQTLTTINKFFDNDLNVLKTANELFMHRNTLVYKLDKIQEKIGLNLKQFNDAMIFKIALMVESYVKYIEEQGV